MGIVQQRVIGHRHWTYADLRRLPDDGKRYEILDGKLAVTPSPTTMHQRVAANLMRLLVNHVMENDLGRVYFAPLDVVLAVDSVVEPDLLFVAKSREDIVKVRAIEGPPDLAVEILSRGTARRDRTAKASLYARYGIANYWIVDPRERTLETYRLGKRRYRRTRIYEGDVTVNAEPFPALRFALGDVWA